ncbi:hypothetical protein C8F01DRAFT_1136025 [Mycena amicta]|nr:hypothetical protein C8F01DRAFT_1136025 [Mycena amicta]
MQPHQPESSQLEVVGVVSFYIVAALIMVFVNKAVLNHTPDLPFTFLWVQVAVAVLLLGLLAFLNTTRFASHVPEFKLPMFNRVIALNLLPYLSVGFTGLIFNTLCLASVDAAFFQIARGLLLPFTIGVSALQLGSRPSPQVVLASLVVTFGFLIGSAPTLYRSTAKSPTGHISHESALGLLYGSISSLVLSIHAVLKKPALGHVGQSVITLSYCGNLFMATVLIPCLVLNGELAIIHHKFHDPKTDWMPFLVGGLVTGVFGFLLGISHSLSIKVTSPVTHMFSSAAKGVIQTLLGMGIFGDTMSFTRVYSIGTITAGTVYYTYLQTRPKPKPQLPKLSEGNDVEKQLTLLSEKTIGGEKRTFEGKPGWVISADHYADGKVKRNSYVDGDYSEKKRLDEKV